MLTLLTSLVLSQYVRSHVVRDDPTSQCLWWHDSTVIPVEQSSTGNAETPGETEFFAITASFASWSRELVACGSLRFEERARVDKRTIADDGTTTVLFRQVDCDSVMGCENPKTCGNENDCWEHADGALAITTTTFDPGTGRISDSDIELNTPRFIFTTVDSPPCIPPLFDTNCVASDVQNTVTHEVGHVLGLGHSPDPASTMSERAQPGEISKRSLDRESKQFICDTYPAGKPARTCKIPAYDGELGKAKGGCSSAPAPALLFAVFVLLSRRRYRPSPLPLSPLRRERD